MDMGIEGQIWSRRHENSNVQHVGAIETAKGLFVPLLRVCTSKVYTTTIAMGK